jgi:ferredoxin
MSERKDNKTGFEQFFQADGIEMIGQANHLPTFDPNPIAAMPDIPEVIPHLPEKGEADEEGKRNFWYELRHFFRTGEKGDLPTVGKKWIPPLLFNLHRKEYIQGAYPLWLAEHVLPKDQKRKMASLSGLLEEVFNEIKEAGKACKSFEDNLGRLEEKVQQKTSLVKDRFKAFPVIEEALNEMVRELSIAGTESDALDKSVNAFLKAFPRKGLILPYSDRAPLVLFFHQLESAIHQRKEELAEQVKPLLLRINEFLAVDDSKKDSARSPEALRESMNFADQLLNFEALSDTLPEESTSTMSSERRARLEKVQKTLKEALDTKSHPGAYLLFSPALYKYNHADWDTLVSDSMTSLQPEKNFFEAVRNTFDEKMEEAARLFAAIRIAELEISNQYHPVQHDNYFQYFNWQIFSDEEWGICPPFIALSLESQLSDHEWSELNKLLASGRPVKNLLLRNAPIGSAGKPSAEELHSLEPGALAIAHRHSFIMSGTAIHPGFLGEGFEKGLEKNLPVLFHLFVPFPSVSGLDTFLMSGMALESRSFPHYLYDGEKERWGGRFSLNYNPSIETERVDRSFSFTTEGEKEEKVPMSLTFGDLAAQFEDWQPFFKQVHPEYWSDDLIPLNEYLSIVPDERIGILPFVWMLDEAGALQKVAVSWQIVMLTQSGADFWHFLQENAGIHSYQVEQATEKLGDELRLAHEKELKKLQAQHQEELKQVREKAMEEAVEQLSNKLLGLDLSSSAPILKNEAMPVQEKTSPSESIPQEEEPHILELDVEMEEVKTEKKKVPKATTTPPATSEAMEPWIETELCTSCDECKNINEKIFQYDDEGKAIIADPKGGPFRDLVTAAEACPVSIIHPGTPWNPKEKGLEELMKKAERYN